MNIGVQNQLEMVSVDFGIRSWCRVKILYQALLDQLWITYVAKLNQLGIVVNEPSMSYLCFLYENGLLY